MDKISILITTHNRDKLLKEALNSVRVQTHCNWEAIVVDNGYGTHTRDVVMQYADTRISYIKASSNLGECGGRNLAFTRATGDLICYLDDDDVLPKESLAKRLDFYKRHRQCGMVYGEYRRFWVDGAEWYDVSDEWMGSSHYSKSFYDTLLARIEYNQEDTFSLLKTFNFVRGGTPLIKRSVLEAVGLFDERFRNYGDYDLWLRIASRYPIRFINEVVYYYRIHAGSTQIQISDNGQEKQYAIMLCQKHGIQRSIQFDRYQDDISRHVAK